MSAEQSARTVRQADGLDPVRACGFRTISYSCFGRIRTPVSAFSYTRVKEPSQPLA